MNSQIKDTVFFENDVISLVKNKLSLKHSGNFVSLSKNQTTLFNCLINEINGRKEIIEKIWPGENTKSKVNNYNQLIFQTRVLLAKSGFPKDMLITMSMYGVCLHMDMLKPAVKEDGMGNRLFRDQGLFY